MSTISPAAKERGLLGKEKEIDLCHAKGRDKSTILN